MSYINSLSAGDVSKLDIIGSDNGLAPTRRQAIIWTNAVAVWLPSEYIAAPDTTQGDVVVKPACCWSTPTNTSVCHLRLFRMYGRDRESPGNYLVSSHFMFSRLVAAFEWRRYKYLDIFHWTINGGHI